MSTCSFHQNCWGEKQFLYDRDLPTGSNVSIILGKKSQKIISLILLHSSYWYIFILIVLSNLYWDLEIILHPSGHQWLIHSIKEQCFKQLKNDKLKNQIWKCSWLIHCMITRHWAWYAFFFMFKVFMWKPIMCYFSVFIHSAVVSAFMDEIVLFDILYHFQGVTPILTEAAADYYVLCLKVFIDSVHVCV